MFARVGGVQETTYFRNDGSQHYQISYLRIKLHKMLSLILSFVLPYTKRTYVSLRFTSSFNVQVF